MKQFFFTLASTLVGTDVRAVMLGGEASSEDMDRFREQLTTLFLRTVSFLFEIGLIWCTSVPLDCSASTRLGSDSSQC